MICGAARTWAVTARRGHEALGARVPGCHLSPPTWHRKQGRMLSPAAEQDKGQETKDYRKFNNDKVPMIPGLLPSALQFEWHISLERLTNQSVIDARLCAALEAHIMLWNESCFCANIATILQSTSIFKFDVEEGSGGDVSTASCSRLIWWKEMNLVSPILRKYFTTRSFFLY